MRDDDGGDPQAAEREGRPGGSERVAIVTCMDARLDAAGFLELWPDPVHLIRNAGGRATGDVLRSLVVACCALGVNRVLVIHHTGCAMAAKTDDDIRSALPASAAAAAPPMEFLTIGDPVRALWEDVARIKDCPLLPAGLEVKGHMYDLGCHRSYAATSYEIASSPSPEKGRVSGLR